MSKRLFGTREVKATGQLYADLDIHVQRADGSTIDLHEDGRIRRGRIRNRLHKSLQEWRIWQESKAYLRAGGFPHRNFLSWYFRGEEGAVHFVDVGKQWVVDKMDDSQASSMNKIAWGTGAGTTGETDTTLFTEASETRVTATVTQQTTTITGDTYQAVGTITADGTKTITNAGLFDAASSGNMLVKGDHSGVPVLLSDQITYTMKLQVDQ